MNKKALFASLMVVVVLVGVFFLIFNLNKKFSVISKNIGDIQYSALKTSADMFLLEEYLSQSASFAFDKSLKELPKIQFSSPNCNIKSVPFPSDAKSLTTTVLSKPSYCSVLNNQNLSYFCYPDYFSSFQELFYKNFNPYVTKFNSLQNINVPFDFEISILTENEFSITSALPVSIPVAIADKKIGEAVFRPAFKVSNAGVNQLKSFFDLFFSLEEVAADCSYLDSDSEIKVCIKKNLGAKFSYEVYSKDALYLFNFGYPDACFALHIPLWAATPSA